MGEKNFFPFSAFEYLKDIFVIHEMESSKCFLQIRPTEVLLLFSLVHSLRPKRIIEIGFGQGGSSLTITFALKDVREGGRLVSIDPDPAPFPLVSLHENQAFRLLKGSSPTAIPEAVQWLGGTVDFCFIDANHSFDSVYADLLGVEPFMERDSYILLHDAYYPQVNEAVNDFLTRPTQKVIDCGIISRWLRSETSDGPWCGLRLLRCADRNVESGPSCVSSR